MSHQPETFAPTRALMRWRGFGGNREVSPLGVRAGGAACVEEEGGPWGKHGFHHETERPAGMPDEEDA